MTEWRLIDLDAKVQGSLGIPMPPFPVRKETTMEKIQAVDLLAELKVWLRHHGDDLATYQIPAATLAYVCGVSAGREGDHELARRTFAAGLGIDPGNVRLLGELFLAELAVGREEAALTIAEDLVAQPDLAPQGAVYALAAKLSLRHGKDPAPFLDPLIATAPDDPVFWELVARARD